MCRQFWICFHLFWYLFRVSIQVVLHGLGPTFIISGIYRCLFIFFSLWFDRFGVNSQNSKNDTVTHHIPQ